MRLGYGVLCGKHVKRITMKHLQPLIIPETISSSDYTDGAHGEQVKRERHPLPSCMNHPRLVCLTQKYPPYHGVHESSLPVAHLGYQVLSDILFRLGLIANCSHTVQYCAVHSADVMDVAIIITCFGTV